MASSATDEMMAMVKHPDPSAIAEASIHQFDNPKKTRYISLRACGFTITEAQKLVGITMRTRFRWRDDDVRFRVADDNAGDLKKEFGNRYIELEFRRNMRLVLEIDFQVLSKVAENPNATLSTREQQWLNRLRQHYTPQQLEAMAIALGESGDGKDFDFTKFIMGLARGADKLVIAGSRE